MPIDIKHVLHERPLSFRVEKIADEFPEGSIHLLHVDMSPHEYQQHVDMHGFYAPKVAKDGIMRVHDVHPMYGTYKYVMEFLVPLVYDWHIDMIAFHPDSPTTVPIVARKLK